MYCNTKIIISAYKGNVIARLTYPAKSKSIDTFSDLLDLPDEATVGTFRFSSMNEILQETSDPTLKERKTCIISFLIYKQSGYMSFLLIMFSDFW